MKKIYHYKDGTKAVFIKNEKIVFTAKEYKALIADEPSFMPVVTTPLYDYIEKKVQKSVFVDARFADILAEYRKHEFKTKDCTVNDTTTQITFEDGEPCIIQVNPPNGAFVDKKSKGWDENVNFLKENNVL